MHELFIQCFYFTLSLTHLLIDWATSQDLCTINISYSESNSLDISYCFDKFAHYDQACRKPYSAWRESPSFLYDDHPDDFYDLLVYQRLLQPVIEFFSYGDGGLAGDLPLEGLRSPPLIMRDGA